MSSLIMLLNELVRANEFDLFKFIVEKYSGYAINSTDKYGNNSLHIAAMYNRRKFMVYLSQKGASWSHTNDENMNAKDIMESKKNLLMSAMRIKNAIVHRNTSSLHLRKYYTYGGTEYEELVKQLRALNVSEEDINISIGHGGYPWLRRIYNVRYSEALDENPNPVMLSIREALVQNKFEDNDKKKIKILLSIITADNNHFDKYVASKIVFILGSL